MSVEDQSDTDRDELRFMFEQLHGTIVQNYAQSLQILGATITVAVALMGFAFSRETDEPRQKAALFFGAEVLAIFGLLLSVDRARSIHTMAAYLRVFVEPLLTHVKWESRLLQFRRQGFLRGTGGFTLGQWVVYVAVVVVNCLFGNYYLLQGWTRAEPAFRFIAHAAVLALTLGALFYAYDLIIRFEWRQAENLDARWQAIKEAEREAQNSKGITSGPRSAQ